MLRTLLLTVSLFAFGVLGCKDSPRAPVASCTSEVFARGETCRTSLTLLEGAPVRHFVSSRHIKLAPDVHFKGKVSVAKGAVRVGFEELSGKLVEATARPGAPAELVGRPASYGSADRSFVLIYEALEGTPPRAEGLVVEFDYEVGS